MLSLFASLLAAPAAATPARWVVDWGDQRCSLIRETGGGASATMMVRTVPGAGGAELWLFDPQWSGPTSLRWHVVDVDLAPSAFRISRPAFSVRFRGQDGIAVSNLDSAFLKAMAGAGSLRISREGNKFAEVSVPGSGRAIAALAACEDDAMRDWGFEPDEIRSQSRPATILGGAARWLRDEDYPNEAIRRGHEGNVLTRLVVEATGQASKCEVVEGSGSRILDQKTCRVLLDRVRYEPALSASGAPVRGLHSIRISWRMP